MLCRWAIADQTEETVLTTVHCSLMDKANFHVSNSHNGPSSRKKKGVYCYFPVEEIVQLENSVTCSRSHILQRVEQIHPHLTEATNHSLCLLPHSLWESFLLGTFRGNGCALPFILHNSLLLPAAELGSFPVLFSCW